MIHNMTPLMANAKVRLIERLGFGLIQAGWGLSPHPALCYVSGPKGLRHVERCGGQAESTFGLPQRPEVDVQQVVLRPGGTAQELVDELGRPFGVVKAVAITALLTLYGGRVYAICV